jgi:two-component system OmpR family sensor kinase
MLDARVETAAPSPTGQPSPAETDPLAVRAPVHMDVITSLGHEMRGTLGAILGVARVMELKLAGGRPDPAEQARHLRIIRTGAEQLQTLADRVAELAGIDRADAPPPACLDCRDAVTAAVAAFPDPRIRVETPPAPVWVEAPGGAVERVLGELVDNALTHAAAEHIRVRLRPDPPRLEVADDGAGITVDDQQVIFRAYGRGRDAATRAPSAAGLGLCIAQRQVAGWGGRIDVRTAPGEGATFGFGLRSAPAPGDAGTGEGAEHGHRSGG